MKNLNFHLHIHYHQKGIHTVSLLPSLKGFQWTFFSNHADQKTEVTVSKWLENYLQGKEFCEISFPFSFDWSGKSEFTQLVLQAVAKVPFGSFTTYGQIARLIGRPQAARGVGRACGQNPFLLFIPCHRILDSNHNLRGYSAGGISVKKELIDFEGAVFHEDFKI